MLISYLSQVTRPAPAPAPSAIHSASTNAIFTLTSALFSELCIIFLMASFLSIAKQKISSFVAWLIPCCVQPARSESQRGLYFRPSFTETPAQKESEREFEQLSAMKSKMSAQNFVKIGTATSQTQSLLMRLPQELRNYIYTFLFSSTRFTSGNKYGPDWEMQYFIPAPHGLAILLSCRQAYVEVGKSWVGQVLFCFETAKAMVDKLADIPLETRSMIRQIRVSGRFTDIDCGNRTRRYDIYQFLKLLPGLKLDRLTVCGSDWAQASYDVLTQLVKYSDGWKELHYKAHNSQLIAYKPASLEHVDMARYLREPQPDGWQRVLQGRDGLDSGASVTIYRSKIPYLDAIEPFISTKGPWVKFTQALATGQSIDDYQQEEDEVLMAYGEVRKEMLVVVQRGKGVDYEEKQGSPYLKAGDIRADFPGMTWAEIKTSGEKIQQHPSLLYNRGSYNNILSKQKRVDVVDDYTRVDDYVWPCGYKSEWIVV